MMDLSNVASGLIGAILGGVVTWYVSRQLAFVERCHTQIERACEELQNYRVVYAQYYVEYLSEHAKEAGRDWASMAGKGPDLDKLELEHRVDVSRGRLRVHREVLKRILANKAGTTAHEMISLVLQQSAHTAQVDCRVIDQQCDNAMESLLTALPRR